MFVDKKGPVMTRRNYNSIYHELDEMSRYDIPPRSAEVLWELAKERRKIHAAGIRQTRSAVTKDEIPSDLISLRKSDTPGTSADSGLLRTCQRNTTPLLHPAKVSETMLPLHVPLLVLQIQQG